MIGNTLITKLSMLRVRLALVIGVSLGFVVFLVLVLYRGTDRVSAYFQHTQAAYEDFDRYQALAHEAYRHFKQRLDLQLVDGANTRSDVELSRQRVYAAIEQLRDTVARNEDEPRNAREQAQPTSLEYVAKLTAFLEAAMYRFDEAEKLRRDGRRQESLALLSKIMEEDIDHNFQPLIDAAIAGEREQALVARERMTAVVDKLQVAGSLAASFAAVFSVAAGTLLFRSIRRPIEALMRGTDEIASGNLGYRIPVESQDEFGYLSRHFNHMADGLQQQQEKLREASNVLEQKVAERTQQLRLSIEEQRRMDEARRQFFADISHELRTPITVIRGEAEVTLRGRDRDADEYKETLHRIQELARQLGKLVSDLLFLARAETANLQFEWERVDLAELLASVAEDIGVLAYDKSIAVTLDNSPQPLWVRGDKQRLRQVLFILGDNACRYSHADGRIAISLRADGSLATLSFNDRGIGIAPQEMEMIFDRYYRSTNARRSAEDGTGLGLPVAKTIVKAHGGHMSAACTESEGTTFTVNLPQLQDNTI